MMHKLRVKKKIVGAILASDIKNVAKRNGLSEQEVDTIIKEAGATLVAKKPENLKRLGIDEIAFAKVTRSLNLLLTHHLIFLP
jgi:transposase